MKFSIYKAVVVLTAGFSILAPAEGATAVSQSPFEAAVATIASANQINFEVASDMYRDQLEIVEVIAQNGIQLGVTAQIWLEFQGSKQLVHVRSAEGNVVASIRSIAFSQYSTLEFQYLAPRTLSELESDMSIVAAAAGEGSDIQGAYFRESDGVLVLDSISKSPGIDTVRIGNEVGSPSVVVNQVGDGSDTLTVRGGTATANCTAGFSATYGSYIGYISAAHCGVSDVYFASVNPVGASVGSTRRTANYGANADIGFYSVPSGNSIEGSFFGASVSIPTVETGAQNVPVGVTVCRRGQSSGWDCGAVTSINYMPTWSNACPNTTCNPVFIRVEVPTVGGDSGGPWVAGTHAVGIHKGGSSSFSVFSSISRLPAGVSIY